MCTVREYKLNSVCDNCDHSTDLRGTLVRLPATADLKDVVVMKYRHGGREFRFGLRTRHGAY